MASVETKWWGFDIELSHQDVTDLCSAGSLAGGIAALTGALAGTGPLAPVAGVLAAGLAIKAAEFQLVDRGDGVYVPISWIQIPLATTPAGVAAFIHPFPN